MFLRPLTQVFTSSKVTQGILKSMGRRAGIADLIVWIPVGTVCIECKKPATYRWSDRYKRMVIDERAGTQSDEQKEFQALIEKMPGHHYIVAKSVSDVVDYFIKNNIQPKQCLHDKKSCA